MEVEIAIKVEQLKQERETELDKIRLQVIHDFLPRLKAIAYEIDALRQERKELGGKLHECYEKMERTREHYALLIRAAQSQTEGSR